MSDKRINTVRLIWLEAFVAVVKEGTYKDAGKSLDVDPTVIMKYIKKLEKWLSRTLVIYFNGSLIVTSDGNEFAHKAETIIDIMYTSRDFLLDSTNIAANTKYML